MAKEVDNPNEVSTEQESLGNREMELLDLAFERGLEDTRSLDTETVVDKLMEYRQEIEQGARIARAQFGQQFGGMNPESGKFAIARPRSGYFGWDSWEDLDSLTGDATNAWLDEGTPSNLDGSSGITNPLKVGEEAVHVICGIGTYHDSPKVAALDYEVGEEPRATVGTKREFTKTDIQVKWFDRAVILPENALLGAQLYADQGGNDFPYLEGVSFIEYRASQTADPLNMTDDTSSTQDNIVARQ
jgi:hypothetical protein